MDLPDFIERLKEIFEEANPETIKPEAKFREIEGYSSLSAFLILGLINDEYDVIFTNNDLRRSNTIDDIYAIIKSKK